MAYIEERRNKQGKITAYRAQIKRVGYDIIGASFDKKSDAVAWARQQEALMDSGKYVDLREAKKVTLADGLRRYLEECTPDKKGAKQEATRIRAWLKLPVTKKALADVTPSDMARHRNSRIRAHISASTIRSELSLISVIYSQYDSEWDMPGIRNPIKHIKLPVVRNMRDRRLNADEMEKLLEIAEKKHPEMQAIILLLIETAMRRSELMLSTRDQMLGSIFTLELTKNGDNRRVPLSLRARELLKALPERENGMLFSLKPNTVTNYIALIVKEAGLENFRLHDLRHEAISRLFEKGFTIMEVATISGHKTLSVLKRYTHLRAESLVERLG